MEFAPKIRRLIRGDYTITIASLETNNDCVVGLSFCSASDNPEHFRGRQIAIGRLCKYPISIYKYLYPQSNAGDIGSAVEMMLADYSTNYIHATKRERIVLEKHSRFPRWIGGFFQTKREQHQRSWAICDTKS
jgi:hypothetical protein